MRERHVLSSVIKSKEAFDKIQKYVEGEDFSEQGRIIWDHIGQYYDADGAANYVDSAILGDNIARRLAADKHKEVFRTMVDGLVELDASPANVVTDLLDTKRDAVGKQLASALLAGDDAEKLLDTYNDLLLARGFGEEDEEEEARIGFSVEELVKEGFNKDNLIKIMPESLNDRLDGGVKPGHHLVLFARPEMGKTMTVIEMMAGFARQGLTTLYIGNEDPIDDINMRVVNRLSHMDKQQVMDDPALADKKAREMGYENIVLKGLAPGTPREILGLLERYKPDVLVLDQLRNLNMGQDSYVLKLEEAATQARTWAKRYSCVVVSVTQAGDSASGKAVLDLGDVDFSNTGIPSQADVMIGLGATKAQMNEGTLVMSLPKNKVSGRHEYFPVSTEPHLSKLVSLG